MRQLNLNKKSLSFEKLLLAFRLVAPPAINSNVPIAIGILENTKELARIGDLEFRCVNIKFTR
jgi:hypothetical protein